MAQIRNEFIDRWAQYWNASITSGPQGLNFPEIKSLEDVALARKFCSVIQPGGLLAGYTDQEILEASDRLRARIAERQAKAEAA